MQPPQNPYNQAPLPNPMGGPPYQPTPQGSGNTTTLIVTGILGIVCCAFLAPYTWIKSNQEIQSIKSGYGNANDLSTYNITRILGIIGTVLLILGVVGQLLLFVLGVSGVGASRPSTSPSVSIPPSP